MSQGRLGRWTPWLVYLATALACTIYLNERTGLIPGWGRWYATDSFVELQVRAFLAGRVAVFPHPSGAWHDASWGRSGVHQPWGLGIPLLMTPFHLVARVFGAPTFPLHAWFLLAYAATTCLLARALHSLSRYDPAQLGASAAGAGFLVVFPTFVGLVQARFWIFEQTIAIGVLWDLALLAGTVALVRRCTPARLVLLCAAAGFSIMIRPTLAVYGLTTVAIALLVARRDGASLRTLASGAAGYAATTFLFAVGNLVRFGSPFNLGYANNLSGSLMNRLMRWGLPFARVPFATAAKEMLATLFLMGPLSSRVYDPPEAVRPFAVAARYREYYAPTYDLLTASVLLSAVVIACWRIGAHRLWRHDRPLGGEVLTVLGAWALPPSIALFVFYTRLSESVTRFDSDFYPAFAAAYLCVGLAVVAAVRSRAPQLTASAQVAIVGLMGLYLASSREGVSHMSGPIDRAADVAQVARLEKAAAVAVAAPDHFRCNAAGNALPIFSHLDGWNHDCTFTSGMVFIKQESRCVSFAFAPGGAAWEDADTRALAAFRATADADTLAACGPVAAEGSLRRVTLCEPHAPAYVLDGMRLYSIASLDADLNPQDRLKLMSIDSTPAECGQR